MNQSNDANSINCPRQGESARQMKFRSSRYFTIGAMWYFSTREGKDQGPFLSKELAQEASKAYLQQVNDHS